MKKILITGIVAATGTGLFAQCDNSFFPFEEGIRFEQKSFDGKGKEQGRSVSEVLRIEGQEAQVHTVFYDKRGKKVTDGDHTVLCEGSNIQLDFTNFVPKNILEQYGDAHVTVDGDFISLPHTLEVGQYLPNSTGTIDVEMVGATIKISLDMTITERKVEKLESVETPAGTFQAYKIIQKMMVQMDLMGASNTVEATSATWFAKKIGLIRTETYNKKGEVNGYSLLTSFTH